MAEENLAIKYLEYMDLLDEVVGLGNTFNDFFDWVKIPYEQRSDFLIGLILEQAQKILEKIDK